MQDATRGSEPLPAAAERNWGRIIRSRLAGTEPHHQPQEWLAPARWEGTSDAYRRSLAREPTPAAVLIPVVERSELTVLFTQRATGLRNHAGQVSFPGGRIEATDGGPKAAALREAREEIGLDERFVEVVGYLPDHLVITGFRVTPVVAFVAPGFELLLASEEVEDTFEVPLGHLFDPAKHVLRRRRLPSGEWGEFREVPYGKHNVWGATAGMLFTLYRLCTAGATP